MTLFLQIDPDALKTTVTALGALLPHSLFIVVLLRKMRR